MLYIKLYLVIYKGIIFAFEWRMDESAKVATLVSVTGHDADYARHCLEIFNWDMEAATNFAMGEDDHKETRSPSVHFDGVAPLESMPQQKMMRLVDTPIVSQIPTRKVKNSVFEAPLEPFSDFSASQKRGSKKDTLAKLFSPPYALFSGKTYEEVGFLCCLQLTNSVLLQAKQTSNISL